MNRRELLKMIAVLTGGAVIGGDFLLQGCKNPSAKTGLVFTDDDIAFLNEVAETILPRTSTPGAKDAKVGQFITVIVNDCYEEKDQKKKLAIACNNQLFVGTASNIIAGISDIDYKWCHVDTAIVLEHIVLEAVELGLGTCWIGAFKEDEVKKILRVPDGKKIVALLVVGYPDENPNSKSRKDISELVSYNKY